jgi:hypothetical protein
VRVSADRGNGATNRRYQHGSPSLPSSSCPGRTGLGSTACRRRPSPSLSSATAERSFADSAQSSARQGRASQATFSGSNVCGCATAVAREVQFGGPRGRATDSPLHVASHRAPARRSTPSDVARTLCAAIARSVAALTPASGRINTKERADERYPYRYWFQAALR